MLNRTPIQLFFNATGQRPAPQPVQPVVKPGTLPGRIFDQDKTWIDTQGYAHPITSLNREAVEWTIVYLFSHAGTIRTSWAMETKQTYDTKQKAREWLIQTPVMRALIDQLAVLNRAETLD